MWNIFPCGWEDTDGTWRIVCRIRFHPHVRSNPLAFLARSRNIPSVLSVRFNHSPLLPRPPPAEKTKKSLPILLEDPVRRRYKAILTVTFIVTSGLYIIVDVIFQVISNSM